MGNGNAGSQPAQDDNLKKSTFIIQLLTLFCLVSHAKAEQMTLEVIPLQHRMSQDIIYIIQPLVAPGGTVTGMGNQLIIKTTPSNLAEIKNILQSLDRSPRRLMITVRQDVGGQIQSSEHSVSGRLSTGDVESGAVSIKSKDPRRPKEGLIISAGDDENNIRYRRLDSSSNLDSKNTFRVQALEGHHAFINIGQSVPIRSQRSYVGPGGVVTNEYIDYHDATSGFYVLPRLNGDRVTLLAAPRLTRVSPGRAPIFDVQNVETTVSGRLGEWIRLGGIDQSFDEKNRENLSSASAQGNEYRSVLIKVDEIK